jgi:hypothetical protein
MTTQSKNAYKVMLETILHSGIEEEVRGTLYKARKPYSAETPCKDAEFFETLPQFNRYLGDARIHYIVENSMEPELNNLVKMFAGDRNTRQAIVYKPDWFWPGKEFGHVNCILTYQFMMSNHNTLDLYVSMRSSDAYNAFPYDWYAASQHLKWLINKLNLMLTVNIAESKAQAAMVCPDHKTIQEERQRAMDIWRVNPGKIYWYFANQHIRIDDREKVAALIKDLGVASG